MSSRLPALAMALGAAVALLEVAFGELLLREARPTLPDDAIAQVDGVAIPRSDYQRAAAALEADLGRPLDADERAYVVERLVDELLLVEHGLALELPQRDPFLRTQIARAVIDRVQADGELGEPLREDELRLHYDAHASRFIPTEELRLEALWYADPVRAQAAAQQWSSGSLRFEQLRAQADVPPFELPRASLSPNKLRDYLGPSNVERVLAMDVGQAGELLPVDGGVWVVALRGRAGGERPPFEQVRAQVERDVLRVRTEQALAQLLAQLREQAEIELGDLDVSPEANPEAIGDPE